MVGFCYTIAESSDRLNYFCVGVDDGIRSPYHIREDDNMWFFIEINIYSGVEAACENVDMS